VCRRISRAQHSAAGDAAQRADAATGGALHKERDRHALSLGAAVYHAVYAATVSAAHTALTASSTSGSAFSQPAPGYFLHVSRGL